MSIIHEKVNSFTNILFLDFCTYKKNLFSGAMKCANCQLTCHEKCRDKVQLNCTAFERPEDQQHSSTSGSGNNSSSNSNSSSEKDLSTLANISTIVDEEVSEDFDDEGTLKNVDLLSAFCETTDEVSSLITDDESTLVQSAIEDSQMASDEVQSAIMLYNDGFPSGQETVLSNGKSRKFTFYVNSRIIHGKFATTFSWKF